MTLTDIHTMAGPYVLHALSEAERELFEQHLTGCDTCSTEVAELRETVARLADDSWSAPPPRLREKVMADIRQTRQVPPQRPARADRRGGDGRSLRWRHRAALAVSACLLVATAIGGTYLFQEQRLHEERAKLTAVLAEKARIDNVLTAPDAAVRVTTVKGGGRITVVMSPSRNAAVVVLAGAADHGPGKAYQFWTIQGTTPVSAGVLAAGQTTATQYMEGIRGVDLLGLTVEPAGGSQSPTLPVVAQVPMT